MNRYYVTFGNNHIPNGNRFYIEVHAESEMEARRMVFEKYKDKWAFIYTEEEKAEAIDRFDMECLEVLR